MTCYCIQHSAFSIQHSPAKRALTMVELLIVIVIIGIIFGSILVAATHLIGKSKERNTQSVLQVVADAVEEFKREQTAKPTITRNAAYRARYGLYPPDELEVFGPPGPPGAPAVAVPTGLATPTGSVIVPTPSSYQAMRFYADKTDKDAFEYRDLAAMVVAIESYGDASASILARIPDRNRSAGALDKDGKTPIQYLDRPEDLSGTKGIGGGFKAEDLQIRYILDDWGMPISYFAERDFAGATTNTSSSNYGNWNEASTALVRLNGGQPVIFSYGANGKDQLTKDMMGDDAKASLVGDLKPKTPGPDNMDNVIDNPANADNVYSNPALKEKLAKVSAQ